MLYFISFALYEYKIVKTRATHTIDFQLRWKKFSFKSVAGTYLSISAQPAKKKNRNHTKNISQLIRFSEFYVNKQESLANKPPRVPMLVEVFKV